LISNIQGTLTLDDIAKTYRELKRIRSQMKRHLKELHAKSSVGTKTEMEELEEATRHLAEKKTFLRKKFERRAKRKGPYRVP
jgi:polyhydroxyalkanoate synthesis regulator phasin